jgi:CDP-diglyceride synthetase|tara:strand:- start:10331 stop:10798 length:468 start_codon:yes stop_codon:yes gene_type:complete
LNNLPRFIFYLTGLLIISGAFTLLTSDLLTKVNNGTILGTVLFFFFGLIYMNMVTISSRRFMRRLEGATVAPYVFAIFVLLPPAVWVNLYQGGSATSPAVYVPMLLVAVGTGAYFGHRLGLKAQIKFQENLKAYFEQDRRLHSDPAKEEDETSNK